MGNESGVVFDYDCKICGKNTDKNNNTRFPVIYLNEKILVCETCLSFIKDHGDDSTFKVVKK